MRVGGQRHAPSALPLKEAGTHCRGGWLGPRAGLNGCGKSRPPTGIRSPYSPARSQSLYRLSHPAHAYSIIAQLRRGLLKGWKFVAVFFDGLLHFA